MIYAKARVSGKRKNEIWIDLDEVRLKWYLLLHLLRWELKVVDSSLKCCVE